MILPDSDSHTCDLPSHQLVHHGGKCYMIFSFIPTAFLGSCFILFLRMCQTVTNKRISGKVVQISKHHLYEKITVPLVVAWYK